MNGMREGVHVVNSSLRIVSANNAARSIFARGGEVSVSSVWGEGTTFTIELPGEQPAEAGAT